ncbi:ABC transporter substrate-binding protein [Flindersiella endophytica]
MTTQLRGITWNHTRGYAPMAVTAQVYADLVGEVEVRWDRRSLWAFGEQPLDELIETYDLLVIDHPLIGWAAANKAFLPLDDVAAQAIGRSQESYFYQGRHYALAIDAACQVAAARPDLLRDRGIPVPTTWPEVYELARRTGQVALPLNAIDVWSCFVTLCAHYDAPVCGQEFADRDTALRVLAKLSELATLVPEWCRTANPIATLTRMSSTDEVLYCPLAYGYTNYSRDGYPARLLSFHDIPCAEGHAPSGSCLGGAGLAVSARSSNTSAALAYARWVASPDIQRTEFLRAGGQPAARAAWYDAEADRLAGGFFSGTRTTIESAYLRPRYPGFPEFQTGAAVRLRSVVLGSEPAGPVLDQLDALYRESRDG